MYITKKATTMSHSSLFLLPVVPASPRILVGMSREGEQAHAVFYACKRPPRNLIRVSMRVCLITSPQSYSDSYMVLSIESYIPASPTIFCLT